MAQIQQHNSLIQDQELPNMEMQAPMPEPVRKKRRNKAVMTLPRVLFGCGLAALCMLLLYHQMHLTRLTKDIGEQKTALESLQSEYVSLKTKQEQAMSISYIEKYAQETLGMVKMDPSQVEYIEMTNPEVTEVSTVGTTLGDAVANLMRSFTAVLEYLR